MRVIYIAGPFTAPNAWGIEQNVRAAEALGLEVAQLGAMPLIPHANTRFFHGVGGDINWYEGTLELMRRCDAIIVRAGSEDSKGVRAEIDEAWRLKIPVFHDIYSLMDWLRDGAKSYFDLPDQIPSSCAPCGVVFGSFREAMTHVHKEPT